MLGSVHRVGRESPDYQLARARKLIEFLRRYVHAQREFNRRYIKDLEIAKGWLHDQLQSAKAIAPAADVVEAWKQRGDWIERLEDGKRYLENTVREQADWIAKIEDGKRYLENTVREQADWIAKIEEGKRYLENRIAKLEEAESDSSGQIGWLTEQLTAERKRVAEFTAFIERYRKKWWWRWATRSDAFVTHNRIET